MIGVKTSAMTHGLVVAALLGSFPACRSRAESPGAQARPAAVQEEATVSSYQKPSDEELRKRLEPLAYQVTQREGTEPPFQNPYWYEHRPGIYVDLVSGDPL